MNSTILVAVEQYVAARAHRAKVRELATVVLALNDVPLTDVDVDEAEAFMLAVAAGRLTEVRDIARDLRKLYAV
jgi:hypothetical protein